MCPGLEGLLLPKDEICVLSLCLSSVLITNTLAQIYFGLHGSKLCTFDNVHLEYAIIHKHVIKIS